VFGQQQFEFEAGKDQAAEEARDQKQRQHGGEYKEEKIVGRQESARSGKHQGESEESAPACYSRPNTPVNQDADALQDV
jgi:hypothetical protein